MLLLCCQSPPLHYCEFFERSFFAIWSNDAHKTYYFAQAGLLEGPLCTLAPFLQPEWLLRSWALTASWQLTDQKWQQQQLQPSLMTISLFFPWLFWIQKNATSYHLLLLLLTHWNICVSHSLMKLRESQPLNMRCLFLLEMEFLFLFPSRFSYSCVWPQPHFGVGGDHIHSLRACLYS